MVGKAVTRYAKQGDTHIAYQVTGTGPRDVLFLDGFVSHLEVAWEHPVPVRFLKRLEQCGRLIRLDRRGVGMSDRRVPPSAIEEEIDDIRAVLDATGSLRPVVIGTNEGAARAALFAAVYPRRVSALVLHAGWAKSMRSDDHPIGYDLERFETMRQMMPLVWGDGHPLVAIGTSSLLDDESYVEWMGRLARHSLGPGDALALIELTRAIDIRSVLPTIQAPTLVVHRTEDPFAPVEQGRYLAEHIPNATFVELPGDQSAMFAPAGGEDVLGVLEEFITGHRQIEATSRSLATVLFTDVVGSTEHALSLGDGPWRALLSEHDEALRNLVAHYGGRFIKSTGDGMLATFEGPARATRCAAAAVLRARELGLAIRAGLHTGEIEQTEDDIAGIAVHIAARICSIAAADQVLVSSTVRDLVAGSELRFLDCGSHALKGLSQQRQLFVYAGLHD